MATNFINFMANIIQSLFEMLGELPEGFSTLLLSVITFLSLLGIKRAVSH